MKSAPSAAVVLLCKVAGHWCVTDELAGGLEVFNGRLESGDTVRVRGLSVIDTDFLMSRLSYYQPPYGLRLLRHVKDGGTLVLETLGG